MHNFHAESNNRRHFIKRDVYCYRRNECCWVVRNAVQRLPVLILRQCDEQTGAKLLFGSVLSADWSNENSED